MRTEICAWLPCFIAPQRLVAVGSVAQSTPHLVKAFLLMSPKSIVLVVFSLIATTCNRTLLSRWCVAGSPFVCSSYDILDLQCSARHYDSLSSAFIFWVRLRGSSFLSFVANFSLAISHPLHSSHGCPGDRVPSENESVAIDPKVWELPGVY